MKYKMGDVVIDSFYDLKDYKYSIVIRSDADYYHTQTYFELYNSKSRCYEQWLTLYTNEFTE